MQSTLSLPLLRLRVVEPHVVTYMGKIELFDIYTLRKQMTYAKLKCKK